MSNIQATALVPWTVNLSVADISIPTLEEVKTLSQKAICYSMDWWTRTPYKDTHLCTVDYDGMIFEDIGGSITERCGVRPVITIDNFNSFNFLIDDKILIDGKEYIVIGNNKIFYCDDSIAKQFDQSTNIYEKSELKQFVDNWFENIRGE